MKVLASINAMTIVLSILAIFTGSAEIVQSKTQSFNSMLSPNFNASPKCQTSSDTIYILRIPTEVDLLLATDEDEDLSECQLLIGPGYVEDCTWHYTPPESGAFTIAWLATDSMGGFCQDSIDIIIWIIPYICGDANGDKAINVGDAVYVINYIFKSGPAPAPGAAGDANCDGAVNVGDAVHVINYIFKSGPAPCCP